MVWVRVLLPCLSHGMALSLSSHGSPAQRFPEAGGAGEQGDGAPGETPGCLNVGVSILFNSFYLLFKASPGRQMSKKRC